MNSKCFIMIEFTFLMKLMLVRQANQKGMIFVIISVF